MVTAERLLVLGTPHEPDDVHVGRRWVWLRRLASMTLWLAGGAALRPP
ncbi:MAG TPA: hypothetical protein VM510_04425 [Caulifigura sp.]|jgi:hypothetical protein|nr:hypothetical protein [Caulifigura sp.]